MTPAQIAHIMSLVQKIIDHVLCYESAEVLAARAAVEAALRDAPQAEGWGVDANKLLSNAMKPSEIAGPADAQRRRVGELLSWFARLADGQANPKWTTEHAFELAYYIATTPSAPQAEPTNAATTEAANFAGAIAYQLTKRLVIDMPTARSIIDDAIRATKGDKL